MTKKHIFTISLFCLFALLGCKQRVATSADYMSLDEVVFIDKFPKVFDVKSDKRVELEAFGATSLSIIDTLMIVSTKNDEGYWMFFSLPDHKYLGRYLRKGNGPREFLDAPWVRDQYLFTENNMIFAVVYDFQNGKLHKVNITETLQSGQLSSTLLKELPRTLFRVNLIDSSTILCREINNELNMQTRYILDNGERKTTDNLEKLNRAAVKQGEDFNILKVYTKINHDGSRIAEAATDLNQINLYAIDDSFGKTICVGEKLSNIYDEQRRSRKNGTRTYKGLNAYPNYFGALYLNDTAMNEELMLKNNTIQFFDWDGNPLAEVKLDHFVTSYDIDLKNKTLYTVNYMNEEIFQYNISEALDYLDK